MSLQDRWSSEIPAEMAALGARLLDPGDPYRLIGDEVGNELVTQDWAFLYAERGRGAVCPIVLALVTLFQFMGNVSDREAAEQARLRIDWKYALHQEVVWEGFHYSDLCNFRKRLLAHAAEGLVFEQILRWVQAHGLVRKQGKQRSDSTHVLGCVERMSRLELLWESLRLVLYESKQAAGEWLSQAVPAVYWESYAERHSDWKLSESEVKQALAQAAKDAVWLLNQIASSAPAEVQALTAVATLRTVCDQQLDQSGDEVQVKPTPIKGKEVIVSPHDPEARWAKKRSTQWVGYKLQVTETAEPEQAVQFLTDVDLVAANTSDSEQIDAIHERLAQRDVTPAAHYVDQGYASGPNLAHSAERGIELRGPVGPGRSDKPAGYQQEDFVLDFDAHTARCPQGQITTQWSAYPAPEDPSRQQIAIKFSTLCNGCPVRTHCASARTGRSLTISAFHEELSARRQEEQTPGFHQEMHARVAIEGTLSGMVRSQGARRARYRGQAKTRLQMLFTGAATNLKRLARALALPKRPQTQLPLSA